MKIAYLSLLALLVASCGRPENHPSSEVHVPDTSDVRLSQDLPRQELMIEEVGAKKNQNANQVGRREPSADPVDTLQGERRVSDVPPEVLILDPVSIALNKAHLRPRETPNGPWGECNLIINVLALVSMERDNGVPSSTSERNVEKILQEAEASDAEVLEWVSAARAIHASSVASRYIVDVLGDQCGKLMKGEGGQRSEAH